MMDTESQRNGRGPESRRDRHLFAQCWKLRPRNRHYLARSSTGYQTKQWHCLNLEGILQPAPNTTGSDELSDVE
ncbi:hypothetical protein T265_11241 [Opisthorchis viverrini]|uniref:Uncharacterized protein n=1 Tax=Opisthorchis viverrini TaxID=6198 RepID=A0A074ZY93_OPIVI|nr:hypothetical protein T265_11241 [Opisthorchis viverrini]KER20139.1 hypothetical protein T265_11241 [Opisthorchis viverrini]